MFNVMEVHVRFGVGVNKESLLFLYCLPYTNKYNEDYKMKTRHVSMHCTHSNEAVDIVSDGISCEPKSQ